MLSSNYISAAALVLVIAGIVFTYLNSKRSAKSQGLEDATRTIELLTQRINAQDQAIKTLQVDLTAERELRIRLDEQIKLKDKAIKEYLDILQNRDPALNEFIKATTKSMEVLMAGVQELLKSERTVTVTTKSNS